jgi:hypothetical protein
VQFNLADKDEEDAPSVSAGSWILCTLANDEAVRREVGTPGESRFLRELDGAVVAFSPSPGAPLAGSASDSLHVSLVESLNSCALLSVDSGECNGSNNRKEHFIAGREACRRGDAVFSRMSDCVGVSFICATRFL